VIKSQDAHACVTPRVRRFRFRVRQRKTLSSFVLRSYFLPHRMHPLATYDRLISPWPFLHGGTSRSRSNRAPFLLPRASEIAKHFDSTGPSIDAEAGRIWNVMTDNRRSIIVSLFAFAYFAPLLIKRSLNDDRSSRSASARIANNAKHAWI